MRKIFFVVSAVAVVGLSGCLDTDLECGLAGAALGAVVADSSGGNVLTGALVGGAVGVAANDVSTLCR